MPRRASWGARAGRAEPTAAEADAVVSDGVPGNSVRSNTTRRPSEVQIEIALFRALSSGIKPCGTGKIAELRRLQRYMLHRTGIAFAEDDLWRRLSGLYDVEMLDAKDTSPVRPIDDPGHVVKKRRVEEASHSANGDDMWKSGRVLPDAASLANGAIRLTNDREIASYQQAGPFSHVQPAHFDYDIPSSRIDTLSPRTILKRTELHSRHGLLEADDDCMYKSDPSRAQSALQSASSIIRDIDRQMVNSDCANALTGIQQHADLPMTDSPGHSRPIIRTHSSTTPKRLRWGPSQTVTYDHGSPSILALGKEPKGRTIYDIARSVKSGDAPESSPHVGAGDKRSALSQMRINEKQ